MDLLENFDEQFHKVQKASGSMTAVYLQAKDLQNSLIDAYKKLSYIKVDIETITSMEDSQLDNLLNSMNSFIKDCKYFIEDISKASTAVQSLKEH